MCISPRHNAREMKVFNLMQGGSPHRQGAQSTDNLGHMTVRRHSKDYFDAAPPIVASAVRIVLTKSPPYVKTSEMDRDMFFRTNVRPNWWLLGTDMTIQLQPLSGGTQVVANTESQWFIMG